MASSIPRPDSKVLGVVLLVRHGDRQGFYQNATDYSASSTAITPLGNAQEYELGQYLRELYFESSSPSLISNVEKDVVRDAQVQVRADAGGEGGVIFNSAQSLLQGLFPATSKYNTTLANGTTIVAPLGGYQTIPLESVEPGNDVSLEGWTCCNTFTNATDAFYKSDAFKAKAAEHASFLKALPTYLDGRQVDLKNMWNIFDYMNVQYIHNATFAKALPATYLEQARDLANFHEYGVFSSPQPNGIGNIAGQTILPSVLNGMQNIVDSSKPLKFVYLAVSYKPFISLFNMTGAAEMNPELAGIVNYAAAVSYEVRQPAIGGEPVVRFNFKNDTDFDFKTYNFLGSAQDVPLSTFVNKLKPFAFDDVPTWCKVCNNTKDRGCAMLSSTSAAHGNDTPRSKYAVSPVGAGFIGAGVTVAVMIAVLLTLSVLGVLTFGKRKSRPRGYETDSVDSMEKKA